MNFWMFRLAVAAVATAQLALGASQALAQSTPATPPPAVSAKPSPSPSPGPAPAASPAPAPSPSPAPSSPPAAAQAPEGGATAQAADPFGAEVDLEAKKVVIAKGNANWDTAFDTLTDSMKALNTLLEKQGIKPSGNLMIVYTSTDDAGFTFLAEIPVEQDPKDLGKDMSMGKSPEGKALKFVHHGSYDNMDNTYEAITNHLDESKLEAKDTFIEEYVTDPLKTAEDKLVINVYVPLK
jgi:effector-binding domain-containing protein